MTPASTTTAPQAEHACLDYVDREFYLPAQRVLPWNANLAALPGEPGTPLHLTGVVRSRSGGPLSGAEIEVWHADADGCYSGYSVEILRNNLRGIVVTCAGGRFDIATVQPAPCEFSSARSDADVGHLNVIVHARGFRPLETRLVPTPGASREVVASAVESLVDLSAGGEVSCDFVLDPI
ncbi:intradiol ring-cleavage dioxygenase [Rhodococcus jostii]|uniref:Dioxygenase n=1 Tax=Rhodococcus jostii TaxID=132919 RepID=A0A1H5G9I6_RHOJO|nr:intradiol ring-cleavage dioxygenase [Rhodococcus jostii]SEE12393.1 Dioxygenase [Rhodococcus jostii]